jgi:uncharacterized protein YjgD (DUF1641 family)
MRAVMSNAATNIVTAPAPVGPETDRELLLALTRKLDRLSGQVNHLYARTLAMEELKDELVHVARDALGALQVELGAMEHEFNTEEVVHLLRQLLRSTPRFIRLLEHLESLDSLSQELGPLSKEVLRDLVDRLSQWEERGYFQLAQGMVALIDRVAAHGSEQNLSGLLDRIEPLLETLERVTQPEVLALIRSAVAAVPTAAGPAPTGLGLWGLARASRDPDVRRGLAIAVQLLRQLGAATSARPELAALEHTPLLAEHETTEKREEDSDHG